MAKIKFNSIVDEVSGGFGNLVFRASNGKTIMANKPTMRAELSEDQAAHRIRFRRAVAYGRSVMANAEVRAIYDLVAEKKEIPVFALTVADFFNAPDIQDLDVLAYTGKVGDVIKIEAMDDFGVMSVHVSLADNQTEAAIENGSAVETAPGSGQWVYTATTAAPAGINVRVNVVATDRPGGTAVDSRVKTV